MDNRDKRASHKHTRDHHTRTNASTLHARSERNPIQGAKSKGRQGDEVMTRSRVYTRAHTHTHIHARTRATHKHTPECVTSIALTNANNCQNQGKGCSTPTPTRLVDILQRAFEEKVKKSRTAFSRPKVKQSTKRAGSEQPRHRMLRQYSR